MLLYRKYPDSYASATGAHRRIGIQFVVDAYSKPGHPELSRDSIRMINIAVWQFDIPGCTTFFIDDSSGGAGRIRIVFAAGKHNGREEKGKKDIFHTTRFVR
jgi:hypothetical protein